MSKKEWGPHLWKILHTLGESLGNQPTAWLSTDEANEIVFILRDVEKVMPCQLCRQHYNAYRKTHPLEQLNTLRGWSLREGVRKWLFELHEQVNKDRGVESGITLEMIPDLYKTTDIRTEWGHFLTAIKKSTEIGLVSQVVLTNFHRHIGFLRKLVGK